MAKNGNKKTGAVLVQGGGIAGVQASLDLANSGFKVYLAERSAAIGGMMAHLDKTFPTGDCATCIVSPKLVECARNLNVEIHTFSELQEIKGEPGNFRAIVKKYPRYVDEKICNDCGDCSKVCPVDIKDKFNRYLGTRKAISKQSAQAVPNIVSILKNGTPPCKVACPANVNVQGYVQLIKKKEYIKAVNLIRERNPLSAICGRVCTHPCEGECTRGKADAPVAIRSLKRFASDKEIEMIKSGEISLPEEKTPSAGAKKVAIIGAGPAGLTAANDLADRGFAVTVYEALPSAGGMLLSGIPPYRLPNDILNHEVELIRRKGVTFIYNCRVGKDITIEKLRAGNEAIFISTGAHGGRKLGVEGEDLEGVVNGVEFLRGAAIDGSKPVVKGKVIVIGGGNVAVDVARTALRLGAKSVEMISLEQRDEMPASSEEIEATLAEGITIRNGWGPLSITGKKSVKGIKLKRCVSVFDDACVFNPEYDEKDNLKLKADMIFTAIGQITDAEFLSHIGAENRRGSISTNDITLETSIKGIFAGGDGTHGPASVIKAVASGKRAADSIERYLNGEDMLAPRFEDSIRPVPSELLPDAESEKKKPRAVPSEVSAAGRIGNFSEVEMCLTEDQALAEAERCLNCGLCSECGLCVAACEKKAINHNMKEQVFDLEVGSVILTPGIEEFPASAKGEYGHGRYPNVLTSVQFERMLSAAGPFGGHVVRISDGREAKRIAWIQCVGSRGSSPENEYCSSICCMATTKQAMVANEHINGMKASIFYMDIRAFGKDFDQYYERAKATEGIEYIKSMPSRIVEMPGSQDLRIRFLDDKFEQEERDFDLVVLSVGLDPKATVSDAVARLGIELNEYGFCATDRLHPLVTSRPGVFAAGAFQEPKDIPETVIQASAAASMAMELLSGSRNTMITKKVYPGEHDVTDEGPRIGVFVCHCGINIASVVDVERVTEAVSKEAGVALASHTMYTCSDSSLSNIKKMIEEHRLNRVVVASCTPRTHEPLFRETLREAGLNPYLFELANIRDQCSWVHSKTPEAATEKAIELVKMSIARARLLAPLEGESIPVNQAGLVIGGGLAGMTAALSLAEQGFKVHLVERAEKLGGKLHEIYRTFEHDDISGFTAELIKRVENHRNITHYKSTEIAGVAGHIGKFSVKLSGGSTEDISCGAIIVATGAEKAEISEYLYGKSQRVITQYDLEKILYRDKKPLNAKNIVMIQCAGSRNGERPYCSRICCSMAVMNALSIKNSNPGANVFVLYRDIRTYGFREKYYKMARKAGVIFLRFDEDKPPVVSEDGSGLAVSVASSDFPEDIIIDTDLLVLSTGIKAGEDNLRIADMLKVPLNAAGFFVEAHLKLRPVDFATEGIFLCGLAHSPKQIDENISQARAAAARAATVLSKTQLEAGAQVSRVDQKKCISCMTCVKSCPYGAPFMNKDHKAEIAAAKCMGCGICAAECPARAIQLRHFEAKQFKIMLDTLFAMRRYK